VKKTLILTALIFLVMGQLECTTQNICPGELIRDRTLIDRGDGFEICEDCTNTVTVQEEDGTVIEEDAVMEYLGGGYYGYEVNAPPYYVGRSYNAYVTSTSPLLPGDGGACITFNINDCSESITATIAGSADATGAADVPGSSAASTLDSGLDSLYNMYQFLTNTYFSAQVINNFLDRQYEENRRIFDVLDDFRTWAVNMGAYINNLSNMLNRFLLQLSLFMASPAVYLMQNFREWIMSLIYGLIQASFISFLFFEAFMVMFTLLENGDDPVKIISHIAANHAKVVKFMFNRLMDLFTIFSMIAQAGIQLLGAVGNWIPFT